MRRRLLGSVDRRLLRRAARITLFLWSLLLVLSTAGSVLPFLVSGRLDAAFITTAVSNGIGVAVVFGSLLGGASVFLPERPIPAGGRAAIGLVSLIVGALALTTSAALFIASGQFIGTPGAWVLAGVAVVSALLGVLLTREAYRSLISLMARDPSIGRG